ARRSHARNRSVEEPELERNLLALERRGYRSALDAQQDESLGGALHAARSEGGGQRLGVRNFQNAAPHEFAPHDKDSATSHLRFFAHRQPLTVSMLLKTNLVGFNTIVIREFSRIMRIWAQTLVPPAITATLYFVIFGSLIGRRIGEMGGYSYIQYIAPGLIMMSVITNSYCNVVSAFFGAKFGKHIG